jgi:hypothetical protein
MALIVGLQFASRHLSTGGRRGFLRHPILIDSGPRLMGSQPFRTEILRVCSPPSFIGIELKIGGGALVMSLRATLLGLLERDIWNSQISKQAAADMFASTRCHNNTVAVTSGPCR